MTTKSKTADHDGQAAVGDMLVFYGMLKVYASKNYFRHLPSLS